MKRLNLKSDDTYIDILPYTYNVFNDEIRDREVFVDYLNENFNNMDFSFVDKYVDYIYSIIDKSDYILIDALLDNELKFYKSKLEYNYYDEITLEGYQGQFLNTNYLFCIKDDYSKKIIKDNIKFNLSDEYREPMVVETDRKYILNDDNREFLLSNNNIEQESYTYLKYAFIKDGFLQLILYQRDGYIYDYRDIDELYFLKRKNLEIENKNYNTYDYKLFSNDINDDKYINYIYDIIDNVNYIFINRLPYNEECSYKDKLNYTYYDKILLEDKSKDFNTNYIFDIKDNKSKEVIKNNISFNLSDKDRNPIIVDTDKKYILNEIGKEEYEYIDYGFIKDDTLVAVLHQKDGFIDDYRDINIREKIK